MDAELIGRAAVALGAGRDRVDADVDPAAGIDILVTVGERVTRGTPLLRLAAAAPERLDAAERLLQNAVGIGDRADDAGSLVLEVITRP